MNNIYVDELPKSCFDCDCPYTDDYIDFVPLRCPVCAWDWGKQKKDTEVTGYNKSRHKDCPLKPLSDRLAEERKKVCEQIYQLLTNGRMWSTMKDWWLNNGTCIELKQVLDAVETETPNQKIIKKFSKDREYYALLDNLREQHFLVLNKNELDQVERGG
jgi:hypothetical protein